MFKLKPRPKKYSPGPDKTGLIALFCISRNMDFNIECTVLLWWLDTYSHARYLV